MIQNIGKHILFILFAFTLFTGCKKNTATTSSTTPPFVFVEYRNPFLGNYVGNYVATHQHFIQMSTIVGPIDTSAYSQSFTFNITKSSSNDSTLISNQGWPLNSFKIGSNGKFIYNTPLKGAVSYTIIIRNDSLYLNTYYYYSNSQSGDSYFSRFKGLKSP